MNYGDILEIKAQLRSRFSPGDFVLNRSFGRMFKKVIDHAPPKRHSHLPVAIGICRNGREFELAVRIQEIYPNMNQFISVIQSITHGECDIRFSGKVVSHSLPWHKRNNRPLLMGSSVGHLQSNAGTLGCFVKRKSGSAMFVLSNNHVLANGNTGRRGDVIVQRGPSDGGEPATDRIGSLQAHKKIRRKNNNVDGAIAKLDADLVADVSRLRDLGALKPMRTRQLVLHETVFKIGRTSGITKGRVSALEMDELEVGYDFGSASFDDQIEIEPHPDQMGPFSVPGDSGSLVVDAEMRPIGLLFAGNSVDLSYCNPIDIVLSQFKIDIVS